MTTKAMTAEGAAARVVSSDARPYAPSWIDAIIVAIDRLPGPTWLAYVLLQLVAFVVAEVEGWVGGVVTFPNVDLNQAGFAFLFVLPVAVVHYLDRVAGESWDRFRPVTALDERAAARVRYELTTSPARSAWVVLAIGVVFNAAWYFADPVGTSVAGKPLLFIALRVVIEGFIGGVLFMLVYQTLRQLNIVNRLHESATHIDLLQPAALHAMSRLTARSAFGIVLLAVLTGLPFPGIPEQTWLAGVLVFSAPMMGLALAAFFLPLRGLHDLLAGEKRRLLGATADRLHETIGALHELVQSESANRTDPDASRTAQTRIDALSKAQTALVQERDMIGRLSTWPWDPSTLRAVVSAIALPIVLFLVTRMLERFI